MIAYTIHKQQEKTDEFIDISAENELRFCEAASHFDIQL